MRYEKNETDSTLISPTTETQTGIDSFHSLVQSRMCDLVDLQVDNKIPNEGTWIFKATSINSCIFVVTNET